MKSPYRAERGFVLRTPLLPFDVVEELLSATDEALPGLVAKLCEEPAVREALALASPALVERRDASTRLYPMILRSLLRYLLRMAFRTTPLELLAGVSLGQVGGKTQVLLAGRDAYRRALRVDLDLLRAALQRELAVPDVASAVRRRQNPTLHTVAGVKRFIRASEDGGWQLTTLEPDVDVDRLLAAESSRAETGAAVSEASGDDDLRALMVEAQLLVPAADIALTGDPLEAVRREAALSTFHARAVRALDAAEALCARPLGLSLSELREATGEPAGDPPLPVDFLVPTGDPPRSALHADLLKPARALTLAPRVARELLAGAQLLASFSPAEDPLLDFKRRFGERYGARKVPLLEVADPEFGVPLRKPWLDIGAPPLALQLVREPHLQTFGPREQWLLELIVRAAAGGASTVDLSTAPPPPTSQSLPFPDAFVLRATLAAESQEALEAGEHQLLLHPGRIGPSGALAFGRLARSSDELLQQVREHLAHEEALAPDALFAELVHWPAVAGGEVAARPLLRTYELPYAGTSGAPGAQQLSPNELLLSLHQGRLVLRSARFDREVRPRLTSTHQFGVEPVPVYQLLALLAGEGHRTTLGFDWGALAQAPFLPRVTHGRFIFSLASWRLSDPDVTSPEALRRAHRLPRWVCWESDGNELPIDLEAPSASSLLREAMQGARELRLRELFPTPDQLVVSGPEGRYTHDLLVPYVREVPAEPAASAEVPADSGGAPAGGAAHGRDRVRAGEAAPSTPAPIAARQTFTPGSRWLYAKLYAPPPNCERLLTEFLPPLLSELREHGLLLRWHFLRYADPDFHLRLRLELDDEGNAGAAIALLHRLLLPWQGSGVLERLVLDTYEPEYERYGGVEAMRAAESFFQADSELILQLLPAIAELPADDRWQVATYGVDALLRHLGWQLPTRAQLAKDARRNLAKEFGVDAEAEALLSATFRAVRGELEALHRGDDAARLAQARALYDAHSWPAVPTSVEGADLVHLHVHRLLVSAPRPQELVIHDALTRLYRSWRARG